MKDMMGVVFSGSGEINLNELTQKRSVSAMPFGGRYRLIDFILSNMVNSGMVIVGVMTQINYSSLMDHLGSGAPWDLNRKHYGLFILPPYIRGNVTDLTAGNVDQLFGVLTFLRRSRQQYVLLAPGNYVCNMTFQDALEQHVETGADITLIYNEVQEKDRNFTNSVVCEVDENKVITKIEQNPRVPKTNCFGMDMFIIERLRLIEMVEEAYSSGAHDFIRDVILANFNNLNIYGYKYDGYVGRVDSVQNYYENNMKVLEDGIRHHLFEGENLIYTKVKDQVPTRYGADACVNDSLIADGCEINGTVENSIIFRGVHIGHGSVVKNCIIMQNSVIEENCEIDSVVMDKECTLRQGKFLIGQKNFPVILPKRTLL